LSKPDIRKIIDFLYQQSHSFFRSFDFLINWILWRRLHQIVAMWWHYHNSAKLQL